MKNLVVKAKGSMCFKPDWIEVIITLSSADVSCNEAMKRLSEKIGKMIDCLVDIGIDMVNIETIGLTTDMINDLNLSIDSKSYEGRGVKVTQRFKVGVPYVIPYVAEIVDKIMHSGISAEILLVQTAKNRECIRLQLVENAIKSAKKKAKRLAKTSGAKLGNVVGIQYDEKCIEDECYVSQEFFDSCFSPITCGYLFGYEFLPNEIVVTDEVEVEWKLKKRKKRKK